MNPGDVLDGKFEIQGEIGKGSFGTVYEARQTTMGRVVAVKVLLPWVNADENMQKRFKREAEIAGKLTSPHTIKIHEYGATPD
ncbi:MAG: protein kinase, partial [Planctomycetales bacterium]